MTLFIYFACLVILMSAFCDINRPRDLNRECLDDFLNLRQRISRCRQRHEVEAAASLVDRFQKRYRRMDSVRWMASDLQASLSNKRAQLAR